MSARDHILDWAEQGRIPGDRLRKALDAAHALPRREDWRRFLDRLLLWGAATFLAVALIFFLAYNWSDLGRWAKFGLVEAAFVIALAVVGRLGLDRASGKAALFAAALIVGALLALVGQTYQTGADPWELFAVWGVMILPFALLGRLPVLWLLVLLLANLAVGLYFQTFGGLFGLLFSPQRLLWLLFVLNTAALVAWEAASLRIPWLRERWSVRLVAVASGAIACALAVWTLVGEADGIGGFFAWLAWCAAAYGAYRHWRKDLFVLAGGALSAIVVVTTGMTRLAPGMDAGFFLVIGLMVIGLSALAGWWLRQLALEEGE